MSPQPLNLITRPSKLWSREEVLAQPSPVPALAGIYGWYLRESPDDRIVLDGCVSFGGMHLLYAGIAPKAPPMVGKGKTSAQTLRTRVRYHYRGNAEGSTLRLTLGCLLSERLGIQLCRVGSGQRLTFTHAGERILSAWMAENAFVAWADTPAPWLWEQKALAKLDLPLNLSGNSSHAFHAALTAVRAAAKAHARAGPIVP